MQTEDAERLFFEATEHLQSGQWALAKACYQACLNADPASPEAHANLGFIFEHEGDIGTAETHYQAACRLAPEHPQIHLNYGALLTNAKRFSEAESCFRHALRFDRLSSSLWSNLGVLLACTQREAEAEDCYRNALAIDPGYRTAQFNLAYILLRQGRFEEGWQHLEARDENQQLTQHLPFPRWPGGALTGTRLLVTFEGGHGDVIQFSRYCIHLKQAGASTVDLLCQPALKRLLTHLPGIDRVLSPAEANHLPASAYDHWVPLLSLPYHFRITLDTIPAAIPYLCAEPSAIQRWATRLPPAEGTWRIGLVWRGNPAFENDHNRSLPSLSCLTPLWSVPHTTFISLQKGSGEADIETIPANCPITHLGSELADFADTAALLMHLDLVITVDTAVAHLAGALGRPCWLMLPAFKPDWRWLTERTDSPWYPGSMRLFRQHHIGDWQTTIAELQTALAIQTQSVPIRNQLI
ncbi:tetratricopeptide repeat protein [Pseudomonas fluvialis]|uniref:tetratricopeptide repeat protein n=1 Tax=Pseudomonas fluvialis TaxID=1793966 RepID=UPI0035B00A0C